MHSTSFIRIASLVLVFAARAVFAADDWDAPFPGVRHLHRTGPANFNVHAAVVDLCAPGVSVRTTSFDERAQRTSAFASGVGAQLAINADFSCRPIDVGANSPFPPCVGKAAYTTYGVAAHDGVAWPGTFSLDAMLAFGADKVQVFDDAEDQPLLPWMKEVISGHWSLLRDGVLLPNDCPIDPRTGVGLSKDHRTLVMAIADGRNGWRGMTCLEMGQLLQELGADRGFALDSGGSTTMWFDGQGVLNHPSDGTERVVGSHLAVFAGGTGRPAFCEVPNTVLNPAAPLPAVAPLGAAGRYRALPASRLFDTRTASTSGSLSGLTRDAQGLVAAQTGFTFSDFAAFGVPADATAVLLNLTSADAAGQGYATAFPGQLALPAVSTVNYTAGTASANTAVVALGPSRQLGVFTSGPTQLIADLQATFGPGGAGFVPMTPQRVLDTRAGLPLAANVPLQIVAPQASKPAALALDVVATQTDGPGFVTVFPCDEAVPNTSNLNFGPAQTAAASVVARLGPAGLCAVASTPTHLVVDAMGAFVATSGLDYQPVAPVRLVDTRAPGGRWVGWSTRNTPLPLSLAGLPADTHAVALNLTVTDTLDEGFAGVYPCSAGWTNTSNINFRFGQTVANTVLVGTGNGELCLFSSGRAQVILDLTGVFVGPVPAQPFVLSQAETTAPPATAGAPPPSNVTGPEAGTSPAPTSCSSVPGLHALLALVWVWRARSKRGR